MSGIPCVVLFPLLCFALSGTAWTLKVQRNVVFLNAYFLLFGAGVMCLETLMVTNNGFIILVIL